jgi:hypothetical protein
VVSPVSDAEMTWDQLARDDPALAAWCADRWLGAWPPLRPIADPDVFAATRAAWQTLAEHVLAPARHASNGKIGLRFTHRGFGTPFYPHEDGDRQLRVDGADLVVVTGAEHRTPITTLRAACAAAGVPTGTTTGVYTPTTTPRLDEPLPVERDAAARLGDWYGFAASVLEELRAAAPDRDATRLQLWPEHFDLSVDLGDEQAGQRGTFGASPGDVAHPLPYLYITHWSDVAGDAFWNDTAFAGASLGYATLLADSTPRDAALAFFRRGVDRLRAS